VVLPVLRSPVDRAMLSPLVSWPSAAIPFV